MYVITGATGNTGRAIVTALLAAGKNVRALSRDPKKLEGLIAKGAEPAVGNMDDTDFLTKAFAGATAAYAMIPPNFLVPDYRAYQNTIAETLVEAVSKNGVRYIVTLSSVGAHLPEKAGVVQGLHDMEQKFNRISGLNVLHLRPSYFMENILGQIPTIKRMGVMGSPVNANLRLPMVATKDIAEAAVKRLLALDFRGSRTQYILGARDVTYDEVAELIGKAIGKPHLRYVEFPYAEAKRGMMQDWGIGESAADALIEFVESLNAGRVLSDARRTPENTTKTSIEDFASIFAAAYEGANT